MTAQPKTSHEDRRLARLCLEAHRQPKDETCLSEDALAAFVEGRLTEDERPCVMRHLNRCPSCYYDWIEVSSYAQETIESTEMQPDAVPNTESALGDDTGATSLSVWEQLTALCHEVAAQWARLSSPWAMVIPVFAMVAVVSALMLSHVSLTEQLDASYLSFRARAPASIASAAKRLPLLWERSSFAFGTPGGTERSELFTAGLQKGYEALTGREDGGYPDIAETVSEGYIHYELGRWFVLVWGLAESRIATRNDWHEQNTLLEDMMDDIQSRAAPLPPELIDDVYRLRALLRVAEEEPDKDIRRELSMHLERGMRHMAM